MSRATGDARAGGERAGRGRARVDGRTARAAVRRTERRRAILDCARRVFGRKGYHATVVEDIMAEAGIARGTFYLYFGGKRDVFGELLDALLAGVREVITKVRLGGGAPPAVEQLRANVARITAALLADPDFARFLLREPVGIDPEFDARIRAFYGELEALLERSLSYGREMGLVRALDVEIVARCVLGAVKEALASVLSRRGDPDQKLAAQRAAEELLRFALTGVLDPRR
ncbi:MAG TPA: TetR/AcrR family transcriptional regulator [Myxococcota bacterium]|jgi:AcrR family transcriptional regulator|nr:TetR/AcrR family transcriptional regulator [Myxococcota bacterium]